MARMDSIVEVDAGEDREHMSLQERNQQFKCGERNCQRQRRDAADPAALRR